MADISSKPTMTPRELKDGSAWQIEVIWPDGRNEQVGDFQSDSECYDWISQKSDVWLKAHPQR